MWRTFLATLLVLCCGSLTQAQATRAGSNRPTVQELRSARMNNPSLSTTQAGAAVRRANQLDQQRASISGNHSSRDLDRITGRRPSGRPATLPSFAPSNPDRWQSGSRLPNASPGGNRPIYRPGVYPPRDEVTTLPWPSRPNRPGNDWDRPNRPNRPDWNRPDYGRPDYGRPGYGRPDWNRPGYGYDYDRWHRPYYYGLHRHWGPNFWIGGYQPLYSNYYSYSSGGTVISIGGGRITYVNPFYVRPTVVVPAFDYSQPIRVPDINYTETQSDLVRSEQAIRRFDDARELFRRGEYGRANDLIDEAIKLLPGDPELHQFRALVLQARGKYPEAAAAIYAVLAVSPAWDGATVARLYEDPKRYRAQVGDLADYVALHPRDASTRFLLGYNQLILGELPAAERSFATVAADKPSDRVTQALLEAIRSEENTLR